MMSVGVLLPLAPSCSGLTFVGDVDTHQDNLPDRMGHKVGFRLDWLSFAAEPAGTKTL